MKKTHNIARTTRRKVVVMLFAGYASVLAMSDSAPADLFERIVFPAPAMAQSMAEGQGKVISVVPEKGQIVLEHGNIKGFMDAMTMGYKVSSMSLLKGLKPGDEVRFTIDTQKSTIVKIVKVEK